MSSNNAALRAAMEARLRHQRKVSNSDRSASGSDNTHSTANNATVNITRPPPSATVRVEPNETALPPRPNAVKPNYSTSNTIPYASTKAPPPTSTVANSTPISSKPTSYSTHGEALSNDVENSSEGDAPKTPSTLLRSIRRSIHQDRDEMEKRMLFDDKDGGQSVPIRNAEGNGNEELQMKTDEENPDEELHQSINEYDDEEDTNYDPFRHREFNSSCLAYESEIILRYPSSTALASVAVQPVDVATSDVRDVNLTKQRVCLLANETHGSYTLEENRFTILSETKDDEDCPYLCYGDVVTLRSTLSERVLGIQKMEVLDENQEGGTSIALKVGCFRRLNKFPPADRWVILRPGNAIALGSNLPREPRENIPVYSGDCIVLRNDITGGVLSMGEVVEDLPRVYPGPDVIGWELNLITSSYQMHDGVASTEDDVELIDFLHRHNQCKPGKKEVFRIVTADVPPCPEWVYPMDERGDRCFLDGSYLSYRNRHDLSAEMEDELWGGVDAILLESDGESQRLASLSVDVQEVILLEEVIGAMMGLEGQFIRYYPGDALTSDEDGSYSGQPGFLFAPHSFTGGKIDTTLEEIVLRILPLCTNYVIVNNYVQSCLCNYEYGIMARALCEAMSKLLQEHLDFVSNLNRQLGEGIEDIKSLSMTMVHARTRAAHRTMSTLFQVVHAVQGKKGGELLNSLQKLAKYNYSGDSKCNEILNHLLSVCAVHYARMLKSWLNAGRLHDPYKEFMIEVTNRKFQSNSVSVKEGIEFEDWCRVNDIHVFENLDSFSEADTPTSTTFGVDRHRSTSHMTLLDKVHTTGKYRRAIHFCHDGVPILEAPEKESSPEEDARILLHPLKLSRSIDASYHNASNTLLQMMLEKYDVMASLQLMKKYFLLDQGDFFVEFLDIADDQLSRSISTVSRGQVQNAMESSIGRTSDFILQSSSIDPKQMSNMPQLLSALSCGFKQQSLVEELDDLHRQGQGKSSKGKTRQKELTGFEALQLEFKRVPFPTSLVLSHMQLRIYQFLFRQIFFAKYVERQLVNLWSDHQLMKQMSSLKEMRKTFCLRRRMIHFIQNFVYYIKFEVVEPNWRELESKLNAAKQHCTNPQASPQDRNKYPCTVDDLLAEHNQFLVNVINQCLLTNSDLIRASTKIMTTCLLFTTQMKLFMDTTKIAYHHETTRHECIKMRHSGLAKQTIDNALKSQFREQRQERTRRCSDRIIREVCTENFQHMIARFDNVFSTHLSDFMASLKYDSGKTSNGHYTNLFMQLDYNGFVSSSVENGN